jgi:VIT1/CCC1 family predicted Fe2+/Mn2+ transporter
MKKRSSPSGACFPLLSDTFVETEASSAASLIVFLALFFVNFVVSWIGVILVMDRSLKDAQGRQAGYRTGRDTVA